MMASSNNAPIAATIGIQTGKSWGGAVARIKLYGGCRMISTCSYLAPNQVESSLVPRPRMIWVQGYVGGEKWPGYEG